jgi:hypothetical protein
VAATISCYNNRQYNVLPNVTYSPQSPPVLRPNDKYPVNNSQCSDLYRNGSLRCCLVATVNYIQSLRCKICVYMYNVPFWAEEFWGTKSTVHYGDIILRVLDCVVTVLYGVCLVLWLF